MAIVINGSGSITGISTLSNPAVTAASVTTGPIAATDISGVPALISVPTFRATMAGASNQSISTTTITVANLTVVTGDAQAWYDTVNKRYNPKVAGWYCFSWNLMNTVGTGSITVAYSMLRKNGNEYTRAGQNAGSTSVLGTNGSAIVYMNGTTDYVDVCAYINGTSPSIFGNNEYTNFQGFMIKAGA